MSLGEVITGAFTDVDSTPARRARRRRLLGRHHMHHPRSIDTALDTLDPYSWQPKQQCRTVRHSPWFLPSPECFATLRLQKAKGLLLQRHAHESEITTARLNFKSPQSGPRKSDA